MSNSVILRSFVRLFHAIGRVFSGSAVLRAFGRFGRWIAQSFQNSGIVSFIIRIGKSLSLEAAARRSGILRLINRIIGGIIYGFHWVYSKLRAKDEHSVNYAYYRNLVAPLDSFYRGFYAMVWVGFGFMAVIVLKNAALLRFNRMVIVYAVILAVLAVVALMGQKLHEGAKRSFFVKLVASIFE